jgi:hypothetical protein
MTIIVAETDGSTVLFGADSAWTLDDEIYTIDMPKIFACGPYLFGICGTYRLAQLLRYQTELPEPPRTADLEPFLVQELLPAIRRAVVEDAQSGGGSSVVDSKTGLLLGCQGQLWTIDSRWVAIREAPFAAIGSGRLRAYGALHALHAARVEPAASRLEHALAATAAYTSSVRPPWQFLASAASTPPVSAAPTELSILLDTSDCQV